MSELREFTESIMRISAPAISPLGRAFPGMAGASAAEQGAMTPAADSIHELKNSTAELNKLLQGQSTDEQVGKVKQDIEGKLLSLQSLSVLTDSQAAQLIEQLHNLDKNG
jgi:hypothetical protein